MSSSWLQLYIFLCMLALYEQLYVHTDSSYQRIRKNTANKSQIATIAKYNHNNKRNTKNNGEQQELNCLTTNDRETIQVAVFCFFFRSFLLVTLTLLVHWQKIIYFRHTRAQHTVNKAAQPTVAVVEKKSRLLHSGVIFTIPV